MNALLHLLGLESGTDVARITGSEWFVLHPLAPALFYALVAIGVCMAAVNFLPQLGMRVRVRFGTFLLRLAMVALLLFVLQRVVWHLSFEMNEKQQWVALVDDSASMATRDVDGKTRFDAALADLDRLRGSVGSRVDLAIRTLSGLPLGTEAGHGPTWFSWAVNRTTLSRDRVDRLVVLTDGRDSQRRSLRSLGEDLQNRGIGLTVHLYGSVQPPAVATIAARPERAVIRLGEELSIRGSISGNVGAGERSVSLQENGTEVKNLTVPPESGGRFEVRYRPPRKGRHTYAVVLAGNDTVARNNKVTFNADVVEEKINVLMIEGAPRYEFKILKSVLEVDPLVRLVTVCHLPGSGVYVQGNPLHRNPEQGLISSPAELFKYDVVILRDVPRTLFREGGDTTETRLLNLVQFVTKRGGGLVVMGGQDVYRAGGYESSALTEVLPFDLSDAVGGPAQFDGLFFVRIPRPAYEHPILRLLPDPDANRERLNSLRELDGVNNVGRFKPIATPLMTRTVSIPGAGGKVEERDVPVAGYMAVGEGKVLGFSADTLWRWQLQAEFDDPPLTLLLANAVRYLAPPPGRRPDTPAVDLADDTPQVGEELVLSTQLRDANFDPIRNADLVVAVTYPDGRRMRIYPRDLPETPGLYEYRVRLDLPGPYKVQAVNGKFESVREFVAGAAAGEFTDLSIDRATMTEFAQAARGELADDFERWVAKADTRPVNKPAERDLEVWNSPLVLILFILLVSADCFIRKRQGLA